MIWPWPGTISRDKRLPVKAAGRTSCETQHNHIHHYWHTHYIPAVLAVGRSSGHGSYRLLSNFLDADTRNGTGNEKRILKSDRSSESSTTNSICYSFIVEGEKGNVNGKIRRGKNDLDHPLCRRLHTKPLRNQKRSRSHGRRTLHPPRGRLYNRIKICPCTPNTRAKDY